MSPSLFHKVIMLIEPNILHFNRNAFSMYEAISSVLPPQTGICGLMSCGRGSLVPATALVHLRACLFTISQATTSHQPKCLLPGESSCRKCSNSSKGAEIGGTALTAGLKTQSTYPIPRLQSNYRSIPSYIQTVGTSTPLSPLVPSDRPLTRPTVSLLKSEPSLACK